MENNTLLGILVTCLAVSLFITYSMIGGITVVAEVPEVDLTGIVTAEQVNAIVNTAVAGIVIPSSTTTIVEGEAVPSVDYSGEYVLTKEEFEDEAIEAEALRLATESVESRDFKKAVYDALVLYEVSIESYKDITEIVNVDDADVKGKKNNKVEFDLKVYYFIEGDEDEAYKSRLDDFTIVVDDLDFDEDFEDAEVDEDYMDNLVVKYSREL